MKLLSLPPHFSLRLLSLPKYPLGTFDNFQLSTFHFQLNYPFGLKHGAYNQTRKDVKYEEQLPSKRHVEQTTADAVKFKYYYQEQERQDELGLNWDSFKYRNYDYAIGRFMSIDPLAEKYAYNSTYAFQENKLGLGRELEGLELVYTDSNGVEHAGPFNPDNVPDDWQEVEQDSNELYSEPLPAVEITYNKPSKSTEVNSNNNDDLSAGEILASGSVIAAEISQVDSPAPGPADAVAVVWEVGVLIYAGFVSVKNIINSNNQTLTQPVISPAMPGYIQNSRADKYIPPPKTLPGFPGARVIKRRGSRKRWLLPNGDIGEWDSQHGELEVYDKTGKKHKGAYDPKTGKKLKSGKKNRKTKK